MVDFLNYHYDWFRAFHIIAIIAWMAGLLYLPRLFVYHTLASQGSELSETLKIMERRLFKYIMNPAMIAAWIFGLAMLYAHWDYFKAAPWMHTKLTLVILLTGYHHVLLKYLKCFASDKNKKTSKFFRILNEVPTIIMIAIVILAIVEPF